MIFKSHFFTMLIYAIIVSTMIAFIRFDDKKAGIKYGVKLFLYMAGGVIVVSWLMHFL
ncbi:MAG: hypothetical protein GY765_16555 [bacterium]|nr:hypothetical protein [bacterium]